MGKTSRQQSARRKKGRKRLKESEEVKEDRGAQ